jgi:hypothetical protein
MVNGEFPTVGCIAKRYSVQVHQVSHVIRTRGIVPSGRAGVAHIYSEADVKRIGEALKQIASYRAASASRLSAVK